ncbi:MAG: ComF family protein [Planctomycetota bacterium]
MKGLVRVLDAVAEHWLGSALPTPERAFAEAEPSPWRRDRPESYCSRCGDSVGAGEQVTASDGCASCRGAPMLTTAFVRLGPYEGALREWVLRIKYGWRWTEMAEALGRELGVAVRDGGHVRPSRALVVPMPMPWLRRQHRGIDHAGVLAWGAARELGVPMAPVLARRAGRPQASRPASERARAGATDLRVRRCSSARRRGRAGGRWRGTHMVLVDDVRTTGASIRAAARMLRTLQPARIVAAVVAVADDPARRPAGHEEPIPRSADGSGRGRRPVLSRLPVGSG